LLLSQSSKFLLVSTKAWSDKLERFKQQWPMLWCYYMQCLYILGYITPKLIHPLYWVILVNCLYSRVQCLTFCP